MRKCGESVKKFLLLIVGMIWLLPLHATETALYEGAVYSVFVHPLIAYPEKAFNGGEHQPYMEDWFITVEEFRLLLPQLYDRGFMLIKPSDIYAYNESTKKIEKKPLYLPAGKKPLLFSADDLNYYETMKKGGTNHRLIVDPYGNLAVETVIDETTRIFSRSTEFMFLIDDFVTDHPDFSLDGAKGVIAPTGYHGVFGYPTQNPNAPDFAKNVAAAKKVADALKKNGWEFASHGYAHLDSNLVSAEQLTEDCRLWEKTVAPVVGKTNIFIYPKGSEPHSKPQNLKVLLDAGFYFFFGVGEGIYNKWNGSSVLIRRRELDGVYFRSQEVFSSPFFDITAVTKRYKKNR